MPGQRRRRRQSKKQRSQSSWFYSTIAKGGSRKLITFNRVLVAKWLHASPSKTLRFEDREDTSTRKRHSDPQCSIVTEGYRRTRYRKTKSGSLRDGSEPTFVVNSLKSNNNRKQIKYHVAHRQSTDRIKRYNMSSTGASTPTGHDNLNSEDASSGDWRVNFPQSKRNAEVRALARELANLEPGASEASKLRLAMQVEDVMFKQGTSEADYRKRLAKRLNKVKKSYKPVLNNTQKKESAMQSLRTRYGESLQYIAKHAETAVKEWTAKYGEEKTLQYKQHSDAAIQWAKELGIIEGTKPNYTMPDASLEKLQGYLEHRVESIRAHIVKVVDPDLFLRETLQRVEDDFKDKSQAVKLQSECLQRRYAQLQRISIDKIDANMIVTKALQQVSKPVPIEATAIPSSDGAGATRTNRKKADPMDMEKAALLHLDRMRGASSLVLGYLLTTDKYSIPRNTLPKAHDTVVAGVDIVVHTMRQHREKQQKDTLQSIQLQDAWLKHLTFPQKVDGDETVSNKTCPPPAVPFRTRVLLTSGRKTPANLLPALKAKGVRLTRPPPTGSGTYLQLDFGKAFTMTIYLSPLVVTIRAYRESNLSDEEKTEASELKCATWTPLSFGLQHCDLAAGSTLKSDYETIGLAVQERLRDASAHATQVLRQCFAVSGTASTDFEVEILEASSLLEFVQLARATYSPDWKDDV